MPKWREFKKPAGEQIVQGYLHSSEALTIRIRVKDKKAFLTIKGKTVNISRPEFEYEIPILEAKEMLSFFCDKKIEKTRYSISIEKHIWEIDEFHGKLAGLIIAEIELRSESENFSKPDFILAEVSHDERYFNARLIELEDLQSL